MLVSCLGSGPWSAAWDHTLVSQTPVFYPPPRALTHESASQSKTLKDVSLLYIVKPVAKTSPLNIFSQDTR